MAPYLRLTDTGIVLPLNMRDPPDVRPEPFLVATAFQAAATLGAEPVREASRHGRWLRPPGSAWRAGTLLHTPAVADHLPMGQLGNAANAWHSRPIIWDTWSPRKNSATTKTGSNAFSTLGSP